MTSRVLSPCLMAGRMSQLLEKATDKKRVGLPHSPHPLPHTQGHISEQEGMSVFQPFSRRELTSARIQQRPAKVAGAVNTEAWSAGGTAGPAWDQSSGTTFA